MSRPTTTVGIVVRHTHWDREWYAPFEAMRFQLVRFLGELVETLDLGLAPGADALEVRVTAGEITTQFLAAGSVRAVTPVILPLVLLQRHILGASTAGAVKG